MTFRSRYWLAAVVGLSMGQGLHAQEPAHLGLEPSTPLRSPAKPTANQQIANTIADQLHQNGNLHHYSIQITYKDGTAELNGAVTDQSQREEALRLVHGVPGVERVHDRLVLTGPVKQVQSLEPPALDQMPMPRKDASPAPPTIQPPAEADRAPLVAPGALPTEPMPLYQAAPSPYDLNPPRMPPYAWPSYAAYDNYSRVAYPSLYPYNAWPFVGPVYPYPKIPLGWRKVKLEWQDGKWWYSSNSNSHDWWRLRYW